MGTNVCCIRNWYKTMKCTISVVSEVEISHNLISPYWLTDADDVQLEHALSNCIRQRDELLEIRKLSERQSLMLKRLRETVTAGESICC